MTDLVKNGSFGLTNVGNNSFSYSFEQNANNPLFPVNNWTFTSVAGGVNNSFAIVDGDSAFSAKQSAGIQCLALQQVGNSQCNSRLSQNVSSFTTGYYSLSFRALYRVNFSPSQTLSIDISNGYQRVFSLDGLNGNGINYAKLNSVGDGTNWTNNNSLKIYSFYVNDSGPYTLEFNCSHNGTGSNDTTIFLKDVSIKQILPTPYGVYIAGHSKNTTYQLYDITGQGRHAVIGGGIAPTSVTASENGATVPIKYITGVKGTLSGNMPPTGSGTHITWPAGSYPTNFTICSITRYTNVNIAQRILCGTTVDRLWGHDSTFVGPIYNGGGGGYLVAKSNIVTPITNWCVECGTSDSTVNTPNNVYVNNVAKGSLTAVTTANIDTSLNINNNKFNLVNGNNLRSDFAFQQLVIWNTGLSGEQLTRMSTIQNTYLTTGTIVYPFSNVIGNVPVITNVTKGNLSFNVYFTQDVVGIVNESFTYFYSLNGGSSFVDSFQIASPILINAGIINSVTYTIVIKHRSSAGDSDWSTRFYAIGSNSASTGSFGSIPTTSTVNGIGKITLSYSQTTAGTSPTTFFYSLNGGSLEQAPASSFELSGSALTSISPYSIYVLARNTAGDIYSNVVTGNVSGSKPVINSIVPSLNSLTYSYTASSGGSPSTVKYYYSTDGTTTLGLGTEGTSITVTGLLLNQPYQYYIIAVGLSGTIEIWRSSSELTTATFPYIIGSPPTIDEVVSGKNSVIVYFSGSSDGNPSPTTYLYSLDGGVYIDANTTNSPITINGLTQLKEYSVTLVAQNAGGITASSNSVKGIPEVINPATYWEHQYWTKTNYWKRTSFWTTRKYS